MLTEILSKFANYNLWANQQMISMAQRVGNEKALQNIVSSFPSIYKTFLHIHDAQYLWLHRMQHDFFPEAPSKNFNGSVEELYKCVEDSSQLLYDFVDKMSDEDFKKTLTYKNSKGKQYTSTYSETILHCLNHSTFHRGQIITMLRQMGESELIATDYIAYCRGDNPFRFIIFP